jgi:hypothetical protein
VGIKIVELTTMLVICGLFCVMEIVYVISGSTENDVGLDQAVQSTAHRAGSSEGAGISLLKLK